MTSDNATRDIVQKLWSLCHVLRDDGITYQDYVTELTFLLFLKMMQETKREEALPKGYRWGDLTKREGEDLLTYYRALLLKLGTGGTGMVRDIFTDAQTSLRKPTNLKTLVSEIDKLDWFSARREGLGRSLRRAAGEERRRKEIRCRSVFHAAPADRLHGAADEATGRRDGAGPSGGDGRLSRRR